MKKPRGRPKQNGVSVRLTVNLDAVLAQTVRTMPRAKLSAIVKRGVLGYTPEPIRSSDTAVVSPVKPKSKELVRVEVQERKVSLRFPEKNEDFRQLVRFEMGYEWNGGAWVREYPQYLGAMEERLIEITHRIIHAGFVTEFPRGLMQRVIKADYIPESRRWVMAAPKPRVGWLMFSYPRDEDLYKKLMLLQGAEYNGDLTAVVVRPVWIEELEDCAQMFGFEFTPKAKELLETAKAARDQFLVVDVPAPPTRKKPVKPVDTGEIHDALRDDD